LNFLPPAGQFQNRQRKKAYVLLASELTLLGLNLTSGILLRSWQGDGSLFKGHEDAARALIPVNYVSFGALVSVILYGIVDGLTVGQRLNREDRKTEQRISAGEIHF
jgi:hypothetical protein